MKIVISTDQDQVSAHFGRCPHFTILDVENGKLKNKEVIENPGHSPGFLPQYFAEKGIECIIAGGMGMKAQGLFDQHNIEKVLGITGDINGVIERILNGTLEGGASLCERALGKCEHDDNENT